MKPKPGSLTEESLERWDDRESAVRRRVSDGARWPPRIQRFRSLWRRGSGSSVLFQ